MLVMTVGLIALILRMLTDEVEEPRATAPLPRRAQRGASNSPAPVRRPAAVLMDRRAAV
jgi:hypothetical protein